MSEITTVTPTPTPTPSNATAANATSTTSGGEVAARVGAERLPVVVEQGPVWLAQLAYQPPGWLRPALAVLLVAVVGLSVLGYRRHGIDEDVLGEMATAALTVVFVFALGFGLPSLPGGWAIETLVIGVGGWGLAQMVASGAQRVADGID
jgi:hypothetical protein